MDAWYSAVRQLKDESEDPYLTHKILLKIFDELRDIKRFHAGGSPGPLPVAQAEPPTVALVRPPVAE